MKTILITGATGFVGRNLAESLSVQYKVFAPHHTELELLDFHALENFVYNNHIDIIIHAAVHVPMVNGTENEYFNDMKMFLNIERISKYVEKVLYFGSGAEFDKRYNIRMVKEEEFGKTIPTSDYGMAKYTMNLIARESINIYNLRLFGIFGKYELWTIKFLSNLCCKAVFDFPLTIRKDCYFDFMYVEDLPNIVSWFIEHDPKFHDYNICYGKEFLLSELAQKIKKVSKKKLQSVLLSPELQLNYSADNTRLHTEIEDLKITDIDTALFNLYNYYAKNKDIIDITLLKESR